MITFTTWEEWNDIVEKIKAGLVVCPICSEWSDALYKIPEEYRNLSNKREMIYFENADAKSVGDKKGALEYLESRKDIDHRFCCSGCLEVRAEERNVFDLEQAFDQCDSCEKWLDKGLVINYRKSRNSSIQHLCRDCIKQQEDAHKQFILETQERIRVNSNNKRTIHVGQASDLTITEWFEIIKKYNNKCAYCGSDWSVLEHFIPVVKGGGTTKDNVVPSCQTCNMKKRYKIIDFPTVIK